MTFRGSAAETSADALATAMIGKEYLSVGQYGSVRQYGESLILARQLVLRRATEPSRHRAAEPPSRRAIDLEVHAGEIVGIAAVEGNGQRNLLRTIAGLIPPWSGQLDVRHPIAFIPEDRTTEGLVPELTLTENVVLGDASGTSWRVDWDAAERRTAEMLRVHQVRARGAGARARSLSGGNQQKLILARALEQHPRVLVAENPTRGLDVAAALAVHERLAQLVESGGAVLFHSTDLDEVMERSHRVVVMHMGELLPVSPGLSHEGVGRLMLGAQ